jgi:4-amino-4-deoxy-L-arabinose transferase-like glycosyltransferase
MFNHKRPEILLLCILLFAACVRGLLFTGTWSADSLAYAYHAYLIEQGKFTLTAYVHALRFALLLPVSFCYWLFGVHELSTVLYPFLCSLSSIVLIYYLGRFWFADRTAGLVSAFLLAVFPLDVFYASQLMPEIPLSFLMAGCVYLFLKGERIPDRKWAKWYYLASGILTGIAYLTKIFAVFLVFFFLAYIIYQKRVSTAYLWIAGGFCGILLPEMVFYYLQTGDPIYQIKLILSTPGSGVEPNPGRMYRSDLFLYPYYWFVSLAHFGLFYYAIIPACLYALWKRLKITYIPMLWAGTLLLYLQFGREGKYLIHKEARFLSIITIPCLLVLGYVLIQIFTGKARLVVFWILLGFLTFSSLGLTAFQQTLHRNEVANLRAIADYLRPLPENINVYIDNISQGYVQYFLGYTMQGRLKPFNIHNYRTGDNTYPVDLSQIHRAIVVVNWNMIKTLGYKGYKTLQYPDIIYHLPDHWQLIQTIKSPDNWVYDSLRVLRDLPVFAVFPGNVSQKLLQTIERVLKSHAEKTLIYRID